MEIEIGEEPIDLSEAERLALGEDSKFPAQSAYTEPPVPAMPSSPTASAPFGSLPSYDLDEDPMDGTTSLPIEAPYEAPYLPSFPPESMDGQSLPAFPLDESVPAAAPSTPPELPASFRQKPPPQFGSIKPLDVLGSRSLPTPSSQRPLGTRNLARWASRDEPKEVVRRVPSQTSPRQPSVGPIQSERPASVSRRSPSIQTEAASKPSRPPSIRPPSIRPPSIRPPIPQDVDNALLEPVTAQMRIELPSDWVPPEQERAATESSMADLAATANETSSTEEAGGPPPSTSRGLGRLGSGPPEALLIDDQRASATTEVPPPSKISVPAQVTVTTELPPAFQSSESPPLLTMSELPPTRTSPVPIPSESLPPSLPPEVPSEQQLSERPSAPISADGLEEPASSAVPSIHGVALSDVRGLCDLPEDVQRLLRKRARIERMGTGEDLSFFAVVLVLEGWVKLMPAIADVTCAMASAGDVVFTQGTLEDGVALRVTAGQNGTTLATWDKATFTEITEACPWVADELRLIADSFQALAGTTLGPLGERLDDSLREVVTSKCQVLTLLPHEVLVCEGKPVPGMHIVGAGTVELLDKAGALVATCAPGDFLLVDQVLAGGMSPHTARAASGGALVLFAPRMVAHELLVSVPPLLEILAG